MTDKFSESVVRVGHELFEPPKLQPPDLLLSIVWYDYNGELIDTTPLRWEPASGGEIRTSIQYIHGRAVSYRIVARLRPDPLTDEDSTGA